MPARRKVRFSTAEHWAELQTQDHSSMCVMKPKPKPLSLPLLHGLPFEIQEMIIGYVCDGVYVRTTHDDVEIGAVCIDSNDGDDWDRWEFNEFIPRGFTPLRPRPGLPGWMLLNRQMYRTVIRHFHRHAKVFHMRNLDFLKRTKAVVPGNRMQMDLARIVDLNHWGRCYLVSWHVGNAYVVEFDPMIEQFVQRATDHLGSSTALEQLTIKFGIGERSCIFLPGTVNKIRFRSAAVEMLPKGLHKVTLLLAHPGPSDASPYFFQVLEMVKNELRSLAASLVRAGSNCEEDNSPMIHGTNLLGPKEDPAKCPVWRLTVTSPEYQRARNFERMVLLE